jgi:hypothetical protein
MSGPAPRAIALAHTAFLLLLIAAFALTINALAGAYLVVAFVVIMVRVDAFRDANDTERVLMGILILVTTLCLPISAARHLSALAHYGVVLIAIGAAFVMTRNRELYLLASRYSLLLVQMAVFAYLFVHGWDNFPLENMIFDSSSNGITSYLIVLQANYCAYNFILHRRAANVTPLLTLIICVVGYGRGSILAGTAIVLINILSYITWKSYASALLRVLAVLLVVLTVALYYSEDIADFVEANTKLGSGLFDETRERMLNDYVAKIDGAALVTGADYDGTSIQTDFRDNPHNSFVRAHHIFGLPYLLALALFPLALLAVKRDLSVKLYCCGMLLAVMFRASTEPVLFPTVFDFYFFAFCFALTGNAISRSEALAAGGKH